MIYKQTGWTPQETLDANNIYENEKLIHGFGNFSVRGLATRKQQLFPGRTINAISARLAKIKKNDTDNPDNADHPDNNNNGANNNNKKRKLINNNQHNNNKKRKITKTRKNANNQHNNNKNSNNSDLMRIDNNNNINDLIDIRPRGYGSVNAWRRGKIIGFFGGSLQVRYGIWIGGVNVGIRGKRSEFINANNKDRVQPHESMKCYYFKDIANIEYKCKKCNNATFKSILDMDAHQNQCKGQVKFVCHMCDGMRFYNNKDIINHINTKHAQ